MGGQRTGRSAQVLVVAALLVGVLATAGGGAQPAAGGTPALEAHGSVNQVYVTDAAPNQPISLWRAGSQVDDGTTDAEGSYIFREVPSLPGYTVQQGPSESDPVDVLGPGDTPPQSLYDEQTVAATPIQLSLSGGAPAVTDSGSFGYIETRDGTTLAALVSLPFGAEEGDGPFPVLVEYSGYAPSDPEASTPSPIQLAANLSGYAYVGANVRGTACSGGAFDYFETLQRTDGYDLIETVAAQDWADPAGVGMAGISYPGNAQLFVAQTQPPHLSAIAPLSVVADTYRSTLYPGGILNSGFATDWAAGRDASAQPAAEAYAADRIANGDSECEGNQKLRLQSVEIVPQLDPAAFYEVARGDSLAPSTFVGVVDIPVFLAGAFQDEQTGGHWPTMIDDFTNADPLRVVMTNGTHVDALGPLVAPALMDFFDLYLKREVPSSALSLSTIGPALYEVIFGATNIRMAPRVWSSSLTYAQAVAQYESEPGITVLWENGSADGAGECVGPTAAPLGADCGPQYPYPSFTSTHASWPPPTTGPWTQYLQPDEGLRPTAPVLEAGEARAVASYTYDDGNGSETTFGGGSGDIWQVDASYSWASPDDETSASFLTQPMTGEQRLLGSASADLWIRSTAPDVDLEVTLSEVTPDGDEVYIQSGWLRASHRATAPGSTALQPVHSHLSADAEALSDTEFSLARVEIFPFAHVLRPGSRLRLTVAGPGGNRPFWQFDPVAAPDGTQVEIAMSADHPSRLVLPRISGVNAPDQRPACGSLRAQPCRPFVASGAPTGVTGERATATSMDVTWTAPEADIGDEGFEVVVSPGGATVAAGPGATSATVTGLAAGTYTATVRALDSGGDGPVSSPSAAVDVTTFLDVPVASTFWEDIEWMAAEGITTGFPGELYKPAATVTRQSMSAFMYRLAGEPAFDPPEDPSFSDVTPSNPFFAEIEWMSAEGITTGFAGGVFKPGQAVTRQSMSAFMYRLAGEPPFADPPTSSFTDVATSSLFFTEIEWMAAEGITTGFPGGLFKPGQAVTRQAMSAFMHRLADGPGVGV